MWVFTTPAAAAVNTEKKRKKNPLLLIAVWMIETRTCFWSRSVGLNYLVQSSLKGAEAFHWLHEPLGISGGTHCLTEQVHRWWTAQGPRNHTSAKFLAPRKAHSATWRSPSSGLCLSRVPMPRRSETSCVTRCSSLSSSMERQSAWSVSLVHCHLCQKQKAHSYCPFYFQRTSFFSHWKH